MANGGDFLENTTVVLVGCTGNGKSATGNSILGRKAFQSMSGFCGVTNNCKQQATLLENGRVLNVIDTPGLFDSSSKREHVEKEIVRCVDMARDGIHAVLLVVSLKVRFSNEQAAAIDNLERLFGAKIVDYITVVFTAGDLLEEDETLDEHFTYTCAEAMKELLEKCGGRRVVFDNKTRDETKKAKQLDQLLTAVANTVLKNGGKPYTQELFIQHKNEAAVKGSIQQVNEGYTEEEVQKRIALQVKEKLKKESNDENIKELKQNLESLKKEAIEHVKGEELARNEISKLREQLARVNVGRQRR